MNFKRLNTLVLLLICSCTTTKHQPVSRAAPPVQTQNEFAIHGWGFEVPRDGKKAHDFLINKFGKPKDLREETINQADNTVLRALSYEFEGANVDLVIGENAIPSMIEFTSPKHEARMNIRVGLSKTQLTSILGPPDETAKDNVWTYTAHEESDDQVKLYFSKEDILIKIRWLPYTG